MGEYSSGYARGSSDVVPGGSMGAMWLQSKCISCCSIQIIQGFARLSSDSSGNAISVFVYRKAEKEIMKWDRHIFFPFDFRASRSELSGNNYWKIVYISLGCRAHVKPTQK